MKIRVTPDFAIRPISHRYLSRAIAIVREAIVERVIIRDVSPRVRYDMITTDKEMLPFIDQYPL